MIIKTFKHVSNQESEHPKVSVGEYELPCTNVTTKQVRTCEHNNIGACEHVIIKASKHISMRVQRHVGM